MKTIKILKRNYLFMLGILGMSLGACNKIQRMEVKNYNALDTENYDREHWLEEKGNSLISEVGRNPEAKSLAKGVVSGGMIVSKAFALSLLGLTCPWLVAIPSGFFLYTTWPYAKLLAKCGGNIPLFHKCLKAIQALQLYIAYTILDDKENAHKAKLAFHSRQSQISEAEKDPIFERILSDQLNEYTSLLLTKLKTESGDKEDSLSNKALGTLNEVKKKLLEETIGSDIAKEITGFREEIQSELLGKRVDELEQEKGTRARRDSIYSPPSSTSLFSPAVQAQIKELDDEKYQVVKRNLESIVKQGIHKKFQNVRKWNHLWMKKLASKSKDYSKFLGPRITEYLVEQDKNRTQKLTWFEKIKNYFLKK